MLRIDINEQREKLTEIERKYACSCTDTSPVRRTMSNGVIAVWLQCQRCGRGVRAVSKSNYDLSLLAEYDEQKYSNWRNQHSAEQIAINKLQCQKQDSLWWSNYNQYLQSREWHTLRAKVLERDGELCQACLNRKATQVHHLSYSLYNKLGHSAAFECVAICHSCHEKIHPDIATAQHRLLSSGYNPYLYRQ